MCVGAGRSGLGKEDKAKVRMCRGREVSTEVGMCRGGEKDLTKVRISVYVGAGRSAPGSEFVYECVWKGRQRPDSESVCVGARM